MLKVILSPCHNAHAPTPSPDILYVFWLCWQARKGWGKLYRHFVKIYLFPGYDGSSVFCVGFL